MCTHIYTIFKCITYIYIKYVHTLYISIYIMYIPDTDADRGRVRKDAAEEIVHRQRHVLHARGRSAVGQELFVVCSGFVVG